MSSATRVVVLGGGVGGLEAATILGRKSNFDVTLVDRSPVHYWKPVLHEFAAGTITEEGNTLSFVKAAEKFGFDFVQSSPNAVDRETRSVTLENGRTIPYDYLLVALGARANDFGIQGVLENCYFIDSLKDANVIHSEFRKQLLAARAAGKRLDLAIVGGGATGVQLIAELCKAIDTAPGLGPTVRKESLNAVLVETAPRILLAFPESVSQAATRQLEDLGITVKLGAMVVGADEAGFALKSGEHIPATLRVWAAGVRASSATELFEGLERGRAGQLSVTKTLQTTNDPRIFALGDCSRIEEAPVAPTAQVARQEGIYIGQALPKIANNQTPEPFVYHDKGAVVALGNYNGWGMWDAKRGFGGGFFSGRFARFIHEGLYRQHQAGLVGVCAAVREALKERFSPVKPDLGS
ncbi:NAD(P)/FAD-dependent oxidoreductase [Swingsia samuiensis]|uniref:NAD(P)/FAD-dependent oxidoreductase n=1 Tax=Swingsia samuiensis TaxID=1293412 RepID=A0A4Y6UKW2_9PROT|nr:NAD(P)/FAD-dependent oxidoreductase [Swingsia samuiensis]QDH17278.1 NAD(P)/FAD-dependent oxidoreductase [Swingsia samuiensis]